LVNKKRLENKLNPLDIHVIDLVDDTNDSDHHEIKVSSTKERMKSLGTLLKQSYVKLK
jgi:phosphopantetheine adenylyltransferase